MSTIYVGTTSPYYVQLTVSASADFPTADIVSGEFQVLKPDGSIVTWSGSIVAQSVSSITLRHTLSTSDLDIAGNWRLFGRFFTAVVGDVLRARAASFVVQDLFTIL